MTDTLHANAERDRRANARAVIRACQDRVLRRLGSYRPDGPATEAVDLLMTELDRTSRALAQVPDYDDELPSIARQCIDASSTETVALRPRLRAVQNVTSVDSAGLVGSQPIGPAPFGALSAPLFDRYAFQYPAGAQPVVPRYPALPAAPAQTVEKAELSSSKMSVIRAGATPATYGVALDISAADLAFVAEQYGDIFEAWLSAGARAAADAAIAAALVAAPDAADLGAAFAAVTSPYVGRAVVGPPGLLLANAQALQALGVAVVPDPNVGAVTVFDPAGLVAGYASMQFLSALEPRLLGREVAAAVVGLVVDVAPGSAANVSAP